MSLDSFALSELTQKVMTDTILRMQRKGLVLSSGGRNGRT